MKRTDLQNSDFFTAGEQLRFMSFDLGLVDIRFSAHRCVNRILFEVDRLVSVFFKFLDSGFTT
jgi:hypothetical protein